jgi:hypothetical protein
LKKTVCAALGSVGEYTNNVVGRVPAATSMICDEEAVKPFESVMVRVAV